MRMGPELRKQFLPVLHLRNGPILGAGRARYASSLFHYTRRAICTCRPSQALLCQTPLPYPSFVFVRTRCPKTSQRIKSQPDKLPCKPCYAQLILPEILSENEYPSYTWDKAESHRPCRPLNPSRLPSIHHQTPGPDAGTVIDRMPRQDPISRIPTPHTPRQTSRHKQRSERDSPKPHMIPW
jgi:hypothetical protein